MNAYDYGPGLEQVVVDYLADNANYKPYTDGRIIEGGMFGMAKVAMSGEIKAPEAPAASEAPKAEEKAPEAKTETAMVKSDDGSSGSASTEMMSSDYTVMRGDNLWNIARKHYGDARMWKKIEDANGVKNVRNLKIGQMLKLPK